MKMGMIAKGSLLGLALLSTTAFAANNKGSLQVSEPVTVAGKLVAPGEYRVEWEGSGPEVDVKVLRGKNVVARTRGHLRELGQASRNNSRSVRTVPDGTKSLTELQFQGKKYALTIEDEAAQRAQSEASGSK
ncbi:MAG TPA: hypothetical protein VFA67_19265 [Candidatus Sulfotelmatobacter sp.]|nr:hypothetical protein [Candidatus Sulfotelmatobacter sp.]